MNYGKAIELAKEGKMITRSGWNGKDMYVFLCNEEKIKAELLCLSPSISNDVKTELLNRYKLSEKVKCSAYFVMKAADNSLVSGWLASQTDMLAEDWEQYSPNYDTESFG